MARQVSEGSAFKGDVSSLEQAKLQEEDKQEHAEEKEHQVENEGSEQHSSSSSSRNVKDEL